MNVVTMELPHLLRLNLAQYEWASAVIDWGFEKIELTHKKHRSTDPGIRFMLKKK